MGSMNATDVHVQHEKSQHIWQSSYGMIVRDFQTILATFCMNMLIPMLYQAFFQIGLLLAQPFDSPALCVSAIPIDKLIKTLERDLADARIVMKELPDWEPPKYQQK